MDENRQLEVSDWHDESPPLAVARARIARQLRIPAQLLGIVGTVLLHVLVVQTIVLGTSTRKTLAPTTQGLASTANAAGAESEMTLVVVQPVEATNSKDSLFEEFLSRGSVLKDMPIALVSPDPAPALSFREQQLADDADAESPVNSGDPAGQAQLFGIYSGQIQARIERVWRRPRTPVNQDSTHPGALGEEAFRCQVRIIQDTMGNVQEVLLPQCNGSAAWQRSLVVAIQQASPLPAPPSPTVFTNALTMTFTGFEYRPGALSDDYEIEPRHMQAKNRLDGGSPLAPPMNPAAIAQRHSSHPLQAPTGEIQGTSNGP
jgi:hypothetical protein